MVEIIEQSYGDQEIKDLDLGKKIMEALEKYYAGHSWFVNVCHDAGTASIQLMYKDKQNQPLIWKWGYLLHIKNLLQPDDINKKVMTAGGEILERFRLKRESASSESEILAAVNGLDLGNVVS